MQPILVVYRVKKMTENHLQKESKNKKGSEECPRPPLTILALYVSSMRVATKVLPLKTCLCWLNPGNRTYGVQKFEGGSAQKRYGVHHRIEIIITDSMD